MTWITASLLMFISSIIYYLIIKKAVKIGISQEAYMIANFFIAGLFFLIFNVIKNYSMQISFQNISLIFLFALVFSFIGSAISYEAIKYAPNAGYSLVIQKSYAIYTSFAAIFLFKSSLSINKLFAILVIIISTAALTITKGKKINKQNYLWVILSLISFFCYGSLSLSNKFMVNRGIPVTVVLFYTMVFVTSFSLISFITQKKSFQSELKLDRLFYLFMIGFSVSFFYYFKLISEVAAPNIGYVNAINTASNAFYTVLVALIFKDHLSWKKFLAVAGVAGGLILLLI